MDRNRRSRSRSRDRESNRERGRDEIGRDRGRDKAPTIINRTDRDRHDRERIERDREAKGGSFASSGAATSVPLSKEEQEAKRKERLALVKRITQGTDSDDEGAGAALSTNPGEREKIEGEEEEDDEAEMARLMGFGDFSTTKGKQIDDNKLGAGAGAVSKHKARKYRQYMNRKSGFDRPLAKMD